METNLLNKRCAVIGANGYIGKHLVFYLQKMGIEPFLYDAQPIDAENYKCIDLTSKKSVADIDLNVDFIFMFAGLTGTYTGFDMYKTYVDINEIGLLNILDVIRGSEYRPKVIFPSTRLVYKGVDKALKEEDEKETKTIYAVNKLACEGFLQAYKQSFDIPFSIFRICVPYGNLLSSDYSFGTVGFFIKQVTSGNNITLYGGGDIKRTFTHMEDLCYQIVEGTFTKESDGQIYNVGGETLSLREVATLVAHHFGKEVETIEWPEKDWKIESGHTFFDDTKVKLLLNIKSFKRLVDFTNIL